MKRFLLIILLLFVVKKVVLAQQVDTVQQIQQIRTINQLQQQQQQQVQESFSRATEKLLGRLGEASTYRKTARRNAKTWRNEQIDLIESGNSQLTLQRVDQLYEEKVTQVDSTYNRTIEFIYSRNKVKTLRVFPAVNSFFSMLYYNGNEKNRFDFLKSTNITALQENGAFSNELIGAYAGPFRVSLSTILSKQKQEVISNDELISLNESQLEKRILQVDSTNRANSTLLKVASGGGEGVMTFRTPFINFNGNSRKSLILESEIVAHLTLDLPAAGNYIEENEVNFFRMIGLENKLAYAFKTYQAENKYREGNSGFYAFLRYNIRNVGGTDKFYENLGVKSTNFWMIDYSFGVIYKMFSIYWTDQNFSNNDMNDKIKGRLGLSLIRVL